MHLQFDSVEWDEVQENSGCCKKNWSTASWITEFVKHCVLVVTISDSVWIIVI